MSDYSSHLERFYPLLKDAINRGDGEAVSGVIGQVDCQAPLDDALKEAMRVKQDGVARLIAEYMSEEEMKQMLCNTAPYPLIEVLEVLDRHPVREACLMNTKMFESVLTRAAKTGQTDGVMRLLERQPMNSNSAGAYWTAVDAGQVETVRAMTPSQSQASIDNALETVCGFTGNIPMYDAIMGKNVPFPRVKDINTCVDHQKPDMLIHLMRHWPLDDDFCKNLMNRCINTSSVACLSALLETFPAFRAHVVIDHGMNRILDDVRLFSMTNPERMNENIQLTRVVLPWCSGAAAIKGLEQLSAGRPMGAAPVSKHMHQLLIEFIDVFLDTRHWSVYEPLRSVQINPYDSYAVHTMQRLESLETQEKLNDQVAEVAPALKSHGRRM